MLSRTTQINRSAAFECLAMLIVSGACMVQAPAFGMGAVFMLPASFPLPMLCIDLSVELFVCSLMFLLRLF